MFFTFLKYLLIEFFSQKWFKALFLSLITVLIVEGRQSIIAVFEAHKYLSFFFLVFIYWLRFIIPELIPRFSYHQLAFQRLDLRKSDGIKGISCVHESLDEERGVNINWDFEQKLRAKPIISITKYKIKSDYESFGISHYLKVNENGIHSSESCNFDFACRFNKRVPPEIKISDVYEELEVTADARPFGEERLYGKILNEVSNLKSKKWFRWLC